MEKTTFVKLDRNIQNWRFYKNGNTFRVFLHLLINANIRDNGFENVTVRRGGLATSYGTISRDTGLTVAQVRTAITNLKETGTIRVERHSKFLLVDIENFDKYQSREQSLNESESQSFSNHFAITSQSFSNQNTIISQQSKKYKKYKKERITPAGGDSPAEIDGETGEEADNRQWDGISGRTF